MKTQYERERDAIQKEAARREALLCDLIRTDLVIPFCNKTGMKFSAGMGTWSFHLGDKMLGQDDADKLPKRLWAALEMDCATNDRVQSIGSLICDYEPQRGETMKLPSRQCDRRNANNL